MATTKPDIAALVDQMPETDKEIQAKQKPEPDKPDQPEKPNRTRRPDNYGEASKFTGPDPETANRIFSEIVAGGRENILELIALVRDPGAADFKNYKAAYVLHGLALHVGGVGKERERRLFTETLAAQLGSDKHSKAVKALLIRELQVAGGKEVVQGLGRHVLDEDLGEYAIQALLAIREGAAAQFRNSLATAPAKHRAALIQALGVIRDHESAAALKKALGEEDREVRLAAAWALANLGDATSGGALLKSADAAEGYERIQMTKTCLLLAERLLAAGRKPEATRIYRHLRDTRSEPSEQYVRELAERALEAAP
ncbi:MAG: hypothetical protein FJ398_12525 [Verrucomicrobia bacterium]|nr:hypothetical protein [Verrucomicrobiota bacterium]